MRERMESDKIGTDMPVYGKGRNIVRCGIVDMGSNSVRLSVYDCEAGRITLLVHKKIMAGLAGYVKKGRLTEAGIEKACAALEEFGGLLESFRPDHTGIFATASLRNISNQDEVVNSIRRSTGILPEIISGQEEARLDFLGATHFYPMERGLLADIGGGSTELVWFVKNGPKEMISVPIGSLGLHTRWVEGLIPTAKEREKMRREARQVLEGIDWAVSPKDCALVCGIGGSMRMTLQLAQESVKRLTIKTPGLKTPISSLSGGNQQKVLFARWLLTEPEILLLDEPTRGIDVGAKYEIYQLIIDLANKGKTVLMVSSEMPELLGVCDRILVMSGGRLAGEVDARNTTQEEIMTLAAKYV